MVGTYNEHGKRMIKDGGSTWFCAPLQGATNAVLECTWNPRLTPLTVPVPDGWRDMEDGPLLELIRRADGYPGMG